MVSVKVPLPTQKQSASRSADSAAVQYFVDTYEVVFRDPTDHSSLKYYRATATASKGYISINVPSAKSYNVLLLAGYGRTLLGAGYIHSTYIEVGKENVITITVTAFTPQWNSHRDVGNILQPSFPGGANDFAFKAELKKYAEAQTGYVNAQSVYTAALPLYTVAASRYTDAVSAHTAADDYWQTNTVHDAALLTNYVDALSAYKTATGAYADALLPPYSKGLANVDSAEGAHSSASAFPNDSSDAPPAPPTAPVAPALPVAPPLPLTIDENERFVNVAPSTVLGIGVQDISPSEDTFRVKFHIAKFEPLWKAEPFTEDERKLTIADYTVRLWPRFAADYFNPIILTFDGSDIDPAALTRNGSSFTISEMSAVEVDGNGDGGISFVNTPSQPSGQLPQINADGVLQFDLEYYAFGDPNSGGYKWIIRNGLYAPGEDIGAEGANLNNPTGKGVNPGSFIVVKFGTGSDLTSTTINTTY
jgi:hypothetical protein